MYSPSPFGRAVEGDARSYTPNTTKTGRASEGDNRSYTSTTRISRPREGDARSPTSTTRFNRTEEGHTRTSASTRTRIDRSEEGNARPPASTTTRINRTGDSNNRSAMSTTRIDRGGEENMQPSISTTTRINRTGADVKSYAPNTTIVNPHGDVDARQSASTTTRINRTGLGDVKSYNLNTPPTSRPREGAVRSHASSTKRFGHVENDDASVYSSSTTRFGHVGEDGTTAYPSSGKTGGPVEGNNVRPFIFNTTPLGRSEEGDALRFNFDTTPVGRSDFGDLGPFDFNTSSFGRPEENAKPYSVQKTKGGRAAEGDIRSYAPNSTQIGRGAERDARPHTPNMLRAPNSESSLPFKAPSPSPKISSPFASSFQQAPAAPYFHSRRKGKEEVEKPWLKKKDRRQPWVSWIPFIGLLIGLGLSGLLVWDGMRSTKMPDYCPILDEDFSGGFNEKIWTKEGEVGGYGNGQFEETTTTEENVYIKDGMLIIKPTLQDAKLIENDSVVNLTEQGVCTAAKQLWSSCVTSTNTTNGTIVNPVKSGRINTKKGATIKYGRIEVQAQMPTGDWLWPAVWLLPVNETYGSWPTSGEIDIAESRGNNWTYGMGGNDIVSSALHWGPDATNDAWWRTNSRQKALHTTYSSGFHTYGLIWTPKYLYTYIDTQLLQVLYTSFATPFWPRGNFPLADQNGTTYVDPWSQTGQGSTPFDQSFYLILNVAVGGSNGWFEDGKANKPWVNKSPSARLDFWNAKKDWLPTWQGDGKGKQAYGEMRIKSVKMWQQKGYEGC